MLPGEVLVETLTLSVDPFVRELMDEVTTYADPIGIGQTIPGSCVGRICLSEDPTLPPGALVLANYGWQEGAVVRGTDVLSIDPEVPSSAYLGATGMPGITAWIGMLKHLQPRYGQTVVVSAAAGAVGSIAGQIAKLCGAKVVGIAGGPEKCKHVVEDLGFDSCVDYKSPRFEGDLGEATGGGVDCFFEMAGGPVTDAVLVRMNAFARVVLVGLTADYNDPHPFGYGIRATKVLLKNRLVLEGMIVTDRLDLWPRARRELIEWVRKRKLRYRETVSSGFESTVAAFLGMMRGENIGKQLVRVTP